MKNIFYICIILFSLSAYSQEKKTLLTGTITDSLGIVKNVNIINLKTKQGTSSNDAGEFRIYVNLGDTIQFSSIQHIPKKIRIKKYHIVKQILAVVLTSNTFELDPFELRKNNLSESLSVDFKKTPTNRKDSLLRKTMDFSNIDMEMGMGSDHISRKVKPHKVGTDPTLKFGGVGAKFYIPIKDHESILRKKLAQKKAVPYKILSELGEQFFFEELRIPKNQYFHFLEYCNPLGIERLHKENKIIELIEIFKKESISYLKIIKD